MKTATVVGGTLGVIAGGTLGYVIGKNVSQGSSGDNPVPEFLALMGAIVGGILFSAVGDAAEASTQTTVTTTTAQQQQSLVDQSGTAVPTFVPGA